MRYLILLSLIFSINFAETTLTDEQLDALYQKIEVCKLYKEENAVLKQQMGNCDSVINNYEEALKISEEQILKLEEINKDLVESQKGKWYESPYFVGIITFLLGSQIEFK